jgi:hypothetical protein
MQPNTASIITAANKYGDTSIALNADRINFDGFATFTDNGSGVTNISGGVVESGYIASHNLSGTDTTTEGITTREITDGMLIDLSNGSIYTPNFTLIGGNVTITGCINANSGWIGGSDGFEIKELGLVSHYNGDNGVKITPSGITVGSSASLMVYGRAVFTGSVNFSGESIDGLTVTAVFG